MNLDTAPTFAPLWNELIPRELRQDPDVARQANRVAAFHLAMLVWVPVFAGFYTILRAPLCSDVVLSGGLLLIGSLLLLRRGKSPALCGNLLTGAAWYVFTALAGFTGGAGAPVMVWYASIPMLSTLLSGTTSGVFWTLISILTVSGFSLGQYCGIACPNEVTPSGIRFLQLTGLVGLLSCVYILVYVLKKLEFHARETLHEANRSLERQATTDGLTGIANRRSFDQSLEQEWRRHERLQIPFSVVLIDVDFFKQYNDVYGHMAGDDSLRLIAGAIQMSIRRPGDVAARYGGEEFAVILTDIDDQGAAAIAQAIHREIRALAIGHPRSTVSAFLTVSIGSATVTPDRSGSHIEFLRQADRALYRAKAIGRNQTVHVAPAEHRQLLVFTG